MPHAMRLRSAPPMTEFHVKWLARLGDPVPKLGPLLQDLYLQYVHSMCTYSQHGRPGADMGIKIALLVQKNLIGDKAGLIREHAVVLQRYRTVPNAVDRGQNRYLLKAIEVALADLRDELPEDQKLKNNG